jgi:hypothetical protein
MFKIAIVILTSLVISTPALAQQRPSAPICESVTERTLQFRQIQLNRYNQLVTAYNSGSVSDEHRIEMVAREKITDEAYEWLKLLSYSSVNGYTSNCVEIHFKLKQMGY